MDNPQLAEIIIALAEIDQKLRNEASGDFGQANYLVRDTDTQHKKIIHQIIQEHGYPTEEMIGSEAMKDFWLLVQHQDFDPALQEACLTNCDFEPKEKAYLTDRIRINSGQAQLYGTQFTRKDGKLVPRSIEDEAQVDERRKEVGLETMEEYTKRMNEKK